MLQSASIRLSFWLLGTSQLDLHLLDCSIGMDAYCLMYYWFDLMSCTWGDMAIFIGPNVYYTIRRGVSPYSIIIESPEPHASGKKKKKSGMVNLDPFISLVTWVHEMLFHESS